MAGNESLNGVNPLPALPLPMQGTDRIYVVRGTSDFYMLGSGIVVSAMWGNIGGNISDQLDLNTLLERRVSAVDANGFVLNVITSVALGTLSSGSVNINIQNNGGGYGFAVIANSNLGDPSAYYAVSVFDLFITVEARNSYNQLNGTDNSDIVVFLYLFSAA